jgi:hypothetical protein
MRAYKHLVHDGYRATLEKAVGLSLAEAIPGNYSKVCSQFFLLALEEYLRVKV